MAITLNITTSANTIAIGNTVTINWTFANASSLTISAPCLGQALYRTANVGNVKLLPTSTGNFRVEATAKASSTRYITDATGNVTVVGDEPVTQTVTIAVT